jgi:hypothetical protein
MRIDFSASLWLSNSALCVTLAPAFRHDVSHAGSLTCVCGGGQLDRRRQHVDNVVCLLEMACVTETHVGAVMKSGDRHYRRSRLSRRGWELTVR